MTALLRFAKYTAAALICATAWGSSMPVASALAQACSQTGTNQNCTNSTTISTGLVGVQDSAALTLDNTLLGTISVGAYGAYDAKAVTATGDVTVTNAGTIQAFGNYAQGISSVDGNVSFTNAATGTLVGDWAGIYTANGGSVTVDNAGSMSSAVAVISASGAATVKNSGTISAGAYGAYDAKGVMAKGDVRVTNSGTLKGLGNYGQAVTSTDGNVFVTNSLDGTIIGDWAALYTRNGGNIEVDNAGLISSGVAVINSTGTASVVNSGTITVGAYGSYDARAVIAKGDVSVTNSGEITALGNYAQAISSLEGDVTVINNRDGSITGSWAAIRASTGVADITNYGEIHSDVRAIYLSGADTSASIRNEGLIDAPVGIDVSGSADIVNLGEISGTAGYVSVRNNGTVGRLVNGQGGSGSLPLTYSGALPSTYTIYVTSADHYGQVAFSSPTGTMDIAVDVADGAIPATYYASVITGVADDQIGNTTGMADGWNWELTKNGSYWDLGFIGPNVSDTYDDLERNSESIQGFMALQSASMSLMLGYDCRAGGQSKWCASLSGRQAGVTSGGNQSAGVLVVSYQPDSRVRLGAFLDQQVRHSEPDGLELKSSLPYLGGFVGYDQSGDGKGLQGKLAGVINAGELRITRLPASASSEKGSGESDFLSYALDAELGWGVRLGGKWLATPYLGIRHLSNALDSYSEEASDTVHFPISYSGYGLGSTAARAGLRLKGELTEDWGLAVNAGLEYDIDTEFDDYSGTSAIPGLGTFAIPYPFETDSVRPVGSAVLSYHVDENQDVSVGVYVQRSNYGEQAAASALLLNYVARF